MVLQDRAAHDVQDIAQHGSLAFVSGGTVHRHCRSLLRLVRFVCIKITPSAGTCGPCSPAVSVKVRG